MAKKRSKYAGLFARGDIVCVHHVPRGASPLYQCLARQPLAVKRILQDGSGIEVSYTRAGKWGGVSVLVRDTTKLKWGSLHRLKVNAAPSPAALEFVLNGGKL